MELLYEDGPSPETGRLVNSRETLYDGGSQSPSPAFQEASQSGKLKPSAHDPGAHELENVKSSFRDVTKSFGKYIGDRLLLTLGIAFGLGFIYGKIHHIGGPHVT